MAETTSGQALYQWRQWAIQLSKENNIDPSEVDWLLQGLTPLKSLSLRLGTYQEMLTIPISISLTDFTEKWKQRIQERIPVQYLAGETPWRHFSLTVTPDVHIPRPETELVINIVEKLVAERSDAKNYQEGNWADLGTGSGAIALGLAHAFPKATLYATDISSQALAIAQHNTAKNHLTGRISFHQGSWLAPLAALKHQLSGIVTNPPYIPSQTVLTL
ncbi:MAG: HemK/PrmC family methyltransferase, partial [Phormidesmis sp.]